MKKLFILAALIFATNFYSQSWDYVGDAGFSISDANYISMDIDLQSNDIFVGYQDIGDEGKVNISKFAVGSENSDNWNIILSSEEGWSNNNEVYGYSNHISLHIDQSGKSGLSLLDDGDVLKAIRQNNSNSFYVFSPLGNYTSGWSVNTIFKEDFDNKRYIVGYNNIIVLFVNSQQITISDAIEITELSFDIIYGTGYIAYSNLSDGGLIDVAKVNSDGLVEVYENISIGLSNSFDLKINPLTLEPYIAYQDIGNAAKLTVKKLSGDSWELVGAESISEGVANEISLAFNQSGVPYVAFKDVSFSNKLSVMSFEGDNWSYVGERGISNGDASYPSVKINANDEVHVAFKDGSVSNKASVMKFNVSICGDGIVSGSEQCDDGNDDPNDGCDNCTIYIDQDQDGYFSNLDCDDSNPLIYPGAPEIIDGIDNDCDALVDYDDNDCQLNDESIQTAVNMWEVNPSEAEQIYGHISSWNTSCVTNMSYLFYDFQDFNEDIGNWDVSNVTDMSYMFYYAVNFDWDISNWDVSNVTNMEGMFFNALQFRNGVNPFGLNNWDVSNVTNMFAMFYDAIFFGSPLNNWDVSNVTNMALMFKNCISGQVNIPEWNVSNVTNMAGMFDGAANFSNTDFSYWDVSNVTDMSFMFRDSGINNVSSYGINNWDVSNVTNMSFMFANTGVYGNLENWDVGNVTNMANMFFDAVWFGAEYPGEEVIEMDLGLWNISNVTDMTNMFTIQDDDDLFGLSRTNYDKILMGWAEQDVQQGVIFQSFDANYCEGESARQYLIDNFNWVIGDGGLDCSELSIHENLFSNIDPYPNPASNDVYINIDSEIEAVVFDLLGKELIREKITGRLDISSLEKGTYILNLTEGVNTSTHKIIKE